MVIILKVLLLQQKVCKIIFYYDLTTSVHDTGTLTLIVFMLQFIQYGKNKILTLLLLVIVTKIHSFGVPWCSILTYRDHATNQFFSLF